LPPGAILKKDPDPWTAGDFFFVASAVVLVVVTLVATIGRILQ
jgi:hypothetical protein